jgi:hypothetical protein
MIKEDSYYIKHESNKTHLIHNANLGALYRHLILNTLLPPVHHTVTNEFNNNINLKLLCQG